MPLSPRRQQRGKPAALPRREFCWRPLLGDGARVHEQHAVRVEDRLEAMGDDEDRRARLAKHALNDAVCLCVDRRGRLVADEHLGAAQNRARQTDELALPGAPVVAALADRVLELLGRVVRLGAQPHTPQGARERLVGARPRRVEVVPEVARKHDGVLHHDGDTRAQSGQRHAAHVDAVHRDGAVLYLDKPQQRRHERALARARPADDAEPLASLDGEGHATQRRRQLRSVAQRHVHKGDSPCVGPRVAERCRLDIMYTRGPPVCAAAQRHGRAAAAATRDPHPVRLLLRRLLAVL
mmetsp:Transcript_46700/g.146815  ORF Transcript_46700/g.146815 Transcript_46700/m.146815 type:complete len:296 (+) Transcript_46700:184-1071(+)